MAGRDAELIADLADAGIAPAVTAAAIEIDAVLQRWRRRVNKRELGQRAIAELGIDIDLSLLDVLIAIWAPSVEFADCGDEETMVSTVAARLGIDPSRASRLIAEAIRMGLARRAVSQRDARRTIVELTATGADIVTRVRGYKFRVMGRFLQGWTADEIATFLPLLERFSAWSDQPDGAG